MTYLETPAREYAPGMGEAVALRTIARKITRPVPLYKKSIDLPRRDDISLDVEVAAWCKSNNLVIDGYDVPHGDDEVVEVVLNVVGEVEVEKWEDVAKRVALGSALLEPQKEKFATGGMIVGNKGLNQFQAKEFDAMHHHLRQASILMSGRHLQHGDETQPTRPGEVFTNCSTSATSFLSFYLLLNGSGVGRSFDDEMMMVDYANMPIVTCVIDQSHPDIQNGRIVALDLKTARHLYSDKMIHVFHVPDSREGWGQAVEKMELMAFQKMYRNDVLLLDFSGVRCYGSPIKGMQDRPASGPAPLMGAIANVAKLRDAGMARWRAAMYADHYYAECVLVGGARRAARMSTKTWRDKNVLDFIAVKRGGFLWSSNNSVTVDEEFWELVKTDYTDTFGEIPALAHHAKEVFDAITEAAYHDGTGEPGLITVSKLTWSDEGTDALLDGNFAESSRYKLDPGMLELTSALAKAWQGCRYKVICNPCVTADTWVETMDGPRQVFDLIDKPFVAQVDGKSYQSKGFWKTGDKWVYRVKTNRGQEIRATEDHKVLVETSRKPKFLTGFNVEQEWVEVKDLEPGDKLVLNNSSYLKPNIDAEFGQGWLLGEMVGDGGHNPEKYPSYVRFWGGSQTHMGNRAADLTGTTAYQNVANKTTQVSSKHLNELAFGLISPRAKTLLPALEKKSTNFVAGFLRGLFDADGSVQGNREKGISVRLWQADDAKVKVVQRMLARFGIVSTIYYQREPLGERDLPNGKGGLSSYLCSAGNEIVISKDNILRFAEKIGFYEPEKAARLDSLVSGGGKREPYKERFTTEVVSVEKDDFVPVYDCTVDEVHRFSANGIIVHNCGEIVLSALGGYCCLADVVPFHAGGYAAQSGFVRSVANMKTWDADAEDAFRVAARALIRTNLMDYLYGKEVKRTNRIGVGMTGLHEYAWARFGFGWKDMVDEEKSKPFWLMLSRFKRAVKMEAMRYSKKLGVTVPHTDTTMKPSGTTSKLFGLTEGAHLPSMREYLRWVQFRNDDPLIAEYQAKGYPIRKLRTYSGTTIVGFPTQPLICTLGMGDKLVTAAEATPEEQYEYLRLMEKYWITGVAEDGVTPLHESGNQVSYTLKYDPKVVSFEQFKTTLLAGQSTIRCCSVMPQTDSSAYEYQPEEPTTKAQYQLISDAIRDDATKEDVGIEHVDCSSGACPISFGENK